MSDWTPAQVRESFAHNTLRRRLVIDGTRRQLEIERAQRGETVDLEGYWVEAFCDYCSAGDIYHAAADPQLRTLALLAWDDMTTIEALIAAQRGVDVELADAVNRAEKAWRDFEAITGEAA